MARFRAKRWLLWGLLLLPVVAVPTAYVLARMWVNQQLQRDLTLGKLHLHMSSPRLGWDLEFSADSLRLDSPGFKVAAGTVSAELRLWQSLVNLSPSLRASADTVRVVLAARPEKKGPKSFRLRSKKTSSFPPLRIPLPFRIEAGKVMISRAGRPLAEVGGLAI